MTTATLDEIEVSKHRAEKKLAGLHAERGAALLAGQKFDHSKIAAAQAEVAAHDDAFAEAARQEANRVATAYLPLD